MFPAATQQQALQPYNLSDYIKHRSVLNANGAFLCYVGVHRIKIPRQRKVDACLLALTFCIISALLFTQSRHSRLYIPLEILHCNAECFLPRWENRSQVRQLSTYVGMVRPSRMLSSTRVHDEWAGVRLCSITEHKETLRATHSSGGWSRDGKYLKDLKHGYAKSTPTPGSYAGILWWRNREMGDLPFEIGKSLQGAPDSPGVGDGEVAPQLFCFSCFYSF